MASSSILSLRLFSFHLGLLTLCAISSALAQSTTAPVPVPAPLRNPETPEQYAARMGQWNDAKFGMFIHWGLYAIPADGEWHMRKHHETMAEYKKLAEQFNPVQFNADEWAGIAHDAGMRYMVLTTKHHDGFAMFHSQASDYNIYDATPFKRDPLKELAEACPKHEVKLGAYYSILADWGHPGGGAGEPKWDPAQEGTYDDYLAKVAVPQVTELLSHYGPLFVLWFDNDGSHAATSEQVARIAEAVKLQPQVIVTPRLIGFPGDFETCEGRIPMRPPQKPWELCYTINGSWGYTGATARSLNHLLNVLTEAWGKGGNVLLNVGPTKEGIIPPDSVERLRQIGAWLKLNGEAIYGSIRGPFDYVPWGWATRKKDLLYLLVQQWPKDGVLRLPMNNAVKKAWLLAAPTQPLKVEAQAGATLVYVPTEAPDPNVSVVALQVVGEIARDRAISAKSTVTASENPNGAKNAVVGDSGGDWRIKGTTGWIQLDFDQPKTFSTVRLTTPYTEVEQIELQIKEGETWKTIWTEDKPKAKDFVKTFAPVTAQNVLLTIRASKPGVRVGVYELFAP